MFETATRESIGRISATVRVAVDFGATATSEAMRGGRRFGRLDGAGQRPAGADRVLDDDVARVASSLRTV